MIIKKDHPRLLKGTVIFLIWVIVCLLVIVFIQVKICGITSCSAPVNIELTGENFVWGHVGFVLGLVLLAVGLVVLTIRGSHSNPIEQLIQKEKKEFKAKFGKTFKQDLSHTQRTVIITGMVLSTFIPLVLFAITQTQMGVGVGFILMFLLFYRGVKKIMDQYRESMKEIFEFINQNPKNQLQVKGGDVAHAFSGISYGLQINGHYENRKIELTYSLEASKNNSQTKTKKELVASLSMKGASEFKIEEKSPKASKIEGINTEDVFRKRFTCEGKSSTKIPTEFKELAVNYRRNLFVDVKARQMTYELKSFQLLPFYSAEGIILFLSDLVEMAKAIDAKSH